MNVAQDSNDRQRYTIRLMGLKPGASREKLVAALQRIFPRKSPEEIGQALGRLPMVLTRSAAKEKALKVQRFLESSGGVLEVSATQTGQSTSPEKGGETEAGREREKVPGVRVPKMETPPSGKERRVKPRVHPGLKLHTMGIGEILDRSFRILRQYFWLLFIILLIPQGIFFLMSKAAQFLLGGLAGQTPSSAMGAGLGISGFFAIVIFVVLQFWAQGALIFAVSETYLGHTTSVGASYGAIWRRLGRLVGTLILMMFLVGLLPGFVGIIMAILLPILIKMAVGKVFTGLIIFLGVVSGVWVFLWLFLNWLMVDKVVVLEGEGWMKALRRSKELMSTRTESGFWRHPKVKALLILLIGFVIALGIHFIFQFPGALFNIIAPGGLVVLTTQEILNIVGNALATVFTATAMILYYYDIRLRKEGFDLKMMAENL